MALELTVLRDAPGASLPSDGNFERWARTAVGDREASVAIRIVDEAESRRLNEAYRGKDRPTNVLSFPADLPETVRSALERPPLGDLVICASLVAAEAEAQGKAVEHHWAHLVIHGVLHLLGHDHEEAAEAHIMESLETRLLAGLAIPDPYVSRG